MMEQRNLICMHIFTRAHTHSLSHWSGERRATTTLSFPGAVHLCFKDFWQCCKTIWLSALQLITHLFDNLFCLMTRKNYQISHWFCLFLRLQTSQRTSGSSLFQTAVCFSYSVFFNLCIWVILMWCNKQKTNLKDNLKLQRDLCSLPPILHPPQTLFI